MIPALSSNYPGVMRAAPFFPVAVGLIVGILLDRHLELDRWAYLVGFVCVVLATGSRWVRSRGELAVVFFAACALGAMLHLARARTVPASSVERLAAEPGHIVRLRGSVASLPQVIAKPQHEFSRWTYGSNQTAFLLAVESVEGAEGYIPASGLVRVTVADTIRNIRENERAELFGRLFPLMPPRNPGAFDWSAFHRLQGIVATLRCEHRQNVRVLDDQPLLTFGKSVTWLRTTARGLLTDDLATGASEEASLLEAMVLGHRSQLDRRLNDVFTRSGCIHFLAASGTNVVILISFVWFFARLFRQSKLRCAILMMAAVLLYACLADPRPPILRATVMVITFCTAFLMGRPTSHLNSIAFSAVVLLVWSPIMLFDIGLQLSFAAVLGVVYLSGALMEAARGARAWFERFVLDRPCAEEDRGIRRALAAEDRSPWGRLRHRVMTIGSSIAMAFAVCVGAWLASFPIGAYYFQRVQPWGAVSSALVYLLFSAAMFLGFLKIVVGAVSPTIGAFVGLPLRFLDSFLLWSVERLAALPGASIDVPAAPLMVIAAFYAMLLLFTLEFRRPRDANQTRDTRRIPRRDFEPGRPRWFRWATLVSVSGFAVGVTVWLWPKPPADRLAVTVLAVGRGSATVIELPDGKTVVYDSGTSYPGDVGRNTVVPFLRHRNIRRVDHVYVSHANLDHFSGVPSLIDGIPTGPVLLNRRFEAKSPHDSPAGHLLEVLSIRGHPVERLDAAPARWELGGVSFELLWPPADLNESWSANDTSTVLRLSYAGHSILLTGDIEQPAQRALIERGGLMADVLILPHHGSVCPSLRAFLGAVSPQHVIRSHHEKMRETTNGLEEIVGSTSLHNTGDVGAVTVTLDRRGVQVYGKMRPDYASKSSR